MQTCFFTQLPYLVDNAAAPITQSSSEDLLDFATEECLSTDPHSLTLKVPHHRELESSLELNRQLYSTLRRKQEEISALKETNAQLKKLAIQAEQYTKILEALTTSSQTDSVSRCSPVRTLSQKTNAEPTEENSTGSDHSWISLLTQEEQSDSYTTFSDSTSIDTRSTTSGVKRQLWSSWHGLICEEADTKNYRDDSENSGLCIQSDSKRPRLDHDLVQLDLEHLKAQLDQDKWDPQQLREDSALTQNHSLELSSEGITAERVRVFGAFRGLQVVTETPSVKSDLNVSGGEGKGMCFKISIREHSTVRTKVFPHGKTFTSHTLSGSCRFLWVPNGD